ncbi:MAG: thioredoxin family protein [Bacteroidia bacterium]|nr:thioredoxin family protein [Bacteroidia bacterium]
MILKRNHIIILLLFVSHLVYSQGITFYEGSFDEALKKAADENKLVFVDFYADWCAPCKQLAKDIFPQKEVGEYYNAKFVSLQIDTEDVKNKDVVDKYKPKVYPSLAFIHPDGQLLLLHEGAPTVKELINIAKVATGEEMGFEDLYKKYKDNNKDLNIQQRLLLSAPSFISTQEGMNAEKWIVRVRKMYEKYIETKWGKDLINRTDYQVIALHHEEIVNKEDPMIRFFNENIDEWREEVGDAVNYYIIEYHNKVLDDLAVAGKESYRKELQRIDEDYKKAYDVSRIEGELSPKEKATMYYDAIYMVYGKKNADEYIRLIELYLQKLGETATADNYGEAAQTLYYATDGKISTENHLKAIEWLQRALQQKEIPIMNKVNLLVMMGDSYKNMKEFDKAKECYNQSYIETLSIADQEMQQAMLQMEIKRKLSELELLNR